MPVDDFSALDDAGLDRLTRAGVVLIRGQLHNDLIRLAFLLTYRLALVPHLDRRYNRDTVHFRRHIGELRPG